MPDKGVYEALLLALHDQVDKKLSSGSEEQWFWPERVRGMVEVPDKGVYEAILLALHGQVDIELSSEPVAQWLGTK